MSVKITLKNDFFFVEDSQPQTDNKLQSIVDNEVHMCRKQMEEINHMNWQYLTLEKDGRQVAVNDFDCMQINHRFRKMQ